MASGSTLSDDDLQRFFAACRARGLSPSAFTITQRCVGVAGATPSQVITVGCQPVSLDYDAIDALGVTWVDRAISHMTAGIYG